MELVWFNNNWVAPEEALFPLSNRGLKYGDGLFESFRFVQGQWIYKQLHLLRLRKGVEALRLTLPTNFEASVTAALAQLPAKMPQAFCSLRIFRSGDGKYTPITSEVSWFLEASALDNIFFPLHQKGISIDLAENVILHPHPLANFKTANALPYVLASLEKREKQLDDLLLPGPANNLVEGTSSNLFLIKGNRMITPPLSQGCLDGIVRKTLIQMAENTPDVHLFQEPIFAADLQSADEIWLVNSSKGIRWVATWKNLTFAGVLAQKWQARLNATIQSSIETK